MSDLSLLKELDNFQEYKQFIKRFILENEVLWKLIYYSSSNPLEKEVEENPYVIFDSTQSNKHGVVIFGQKNDEILNSETTTLLISFSSKTSDSNKFITTVFIEFNIIIKGEDIQKLEDGSNRSYKIAKLIDDNFNYKKVENVGEIKKVSFDNLTVNEKNCGYILKYKSISTSYSDEIQIYEHVQQEDSWGITRESYSLITKDTPMLVGIQPCTDLKEVEKYGYDINVTRTMYCDITDELKESTLIKYNNRLYKIQKIVEYEDYLECLLVITYIAKINE